MVKTCFPTLRGNARLREQFGDRLMKGAMAHAYLIQGEAGTGKKTFARLLAAALSCEQRDKDGVPLPCGECNICHKILTGISPDVKILTRGDHATIGIDTIRAIKEDMILSSVESEKKVYIINEAEKMTPAAQNALLVGLEEPPQDVVILLLCEEASALLPTVRSRVQTVHMELFCQEQLAAFLRDEPKARRVRAESEEKYFGILAASGGSLGRAMALLDRREMSALSSRREVVATVLATVHNRMRYVDLYAAMMQLGNKRQELLEDLRLFCVAVRDLIVLKRDEAAPLSFFGSRQEAQQRSEKSSLRTLYAMYDALQEAIKQLLQNANINVVKTALADALRQAPVK